MPLRSVATLNPRKLPVQARSAASVDAILEATIQVLLQDGKERLTTTKVAARAGVSVGTLYQYFPNKSALLQGALRRHLTEVADAVEQVSREQQGRTLSEMGTALVTAFLAAKMRDVKASAAMYAVSSDVDAASIAYEIGARITRCVAQMLATSCEPFTKDAELLASMVNGAMAGVSRRLLESSAPEANLDFYRRELIDLITSYLATAGAVYAATPSECTRVPSKR